MKRIVTVGMGLISKLHVDAINSIDGLMLYGVCDIDESKLVGFDCKHYKSIDQVLADPMVDAIHVLTPHYLHAEMIVKALEANKHVFSEKPLCINNKQLESIEKAVSNSKTKFGLCFQNRFRHTIDKCIEVLRNNTLGDLKGFHAQVLWFRDRSYYDMASWRGTWKYEGGGVMINQAIHTLDLLFYLFGPLTLVDSKISNVSLKEVIEVEDTANLVLKTKDGVIGFMNATNANPINEPVSFKAYFEKGVIEYDESLKIYLEGECIVDLSRKQIEGEKKYWGDYHKDTILAFYDSIANNTPFLNELDSVKSTHECLFEMYEKR